MKKTIIASVLLLSSSAARAFDYGEVIGRNQIGINQNSIYSRAEEEYMDKLNNAKRVHRRAIEAYRQAHLNAMRSDARLRELENQLPQHRAYVSDWADGQVQGRVR